MQPFSFNENVQKSYKRYINTTFPIKSREIYQSFSKQIERNELIWKGPYISLSSEFKEGLSTKELLEKGLIHQDTYKIFEGWRLRYHQELAFHSIASFHNTIVATGTGSGKTEAFLIPIIDYCIRHRGVTGTKALLLYPMNALANDQLGRIKEFLRGTGVTFGIYTGTTPKEGGDNQGISEFIASRKDIQEKRPDILLTNYSMLELLLTRREDKVLFEDRQLKFLVLDEVHTYTGVLGTEVAALLRRLKSHTGTIGSLTCVGTSATIEKGEGGDPKEKICQFASNLFGESFSPDHVVEEHYKAKTKSAKLYEPDVPRDFEYEVLERLLTGQGDSALLEESVRRLCGVLMRDEAGSVDLMKTFRSNRLFSLLEDELQAPMSVEELVAKVKDELPSRRGLSDEDVAREIEAYITLASLVEDDGKEKLVLPKLHNFYRGLNNIQLCTNPACNTFMEQGTDTCPKCHAKSLTFETCRTCGESFLRGYYKDEIDISQLHFTQLFPTESFDADPRTLHLSHNSVLKENDLGKNDIRSGCFCSKCNTISTNMDLCDEICVNSDCNGIMKPITIVVGNPKKPGVITNCPACGDYIGGGRDIVTPLTTFQAPTVSMLTKAMFDNLDEDEKRLLIFADNRQDTAYQAGYINDKINEFIVRQLIYQVVRENDGIPLDRLGALVYQRALELKVEPKYQNEYQKKQKIAQYDFLCFETFCTNKGARTSLEGLGLIQVDYEQLGRIRESAYWSEFLSTSDLDEETALNFVASVLNILRYQQAVDYPLYRWKRYKSNSKFTELRDQIESDDFKLPRDNYFTPKGMEKEYRSATEDKYYKTINLFNDKGTPSSLQAYANKVIEDKAAAKESLSLLKDLLVEESILKPAIIGSAPNDTIEVYQLDPGFITLTTKKEVFECDTCLQKSSFSAHGKCTKYRCKGTLVPYTPDEENYFTQIYKSERVSRIKSAEHSGQISATQREAYEEQFKKGDINLLVCTPTMELGVDIGDLPTVFMMNIPPKPANYAQRSGRAGRAERMFSVGTYSSLSPHDSYYYNNPAEMIRGEITTPLFRLDNPAIIKRHIRSIALEKSESSFPMFLIDMLDGTTLKKDLEIFTEIQRRKEEFVEEIYRVFEHSRIPWLSQEAIEDILSSFMSDLESALQPYFTTLNNLYTRFQKLHTLLGDPLNRMDKNQKKNLEYERNRIRDKLYKMTEDPNEAYTMRVLAQYGFLPSYAFPTNMLQLDAYDFETPIQRDKDIGINEFAPGNLVYVAGGKYEVVSVGLDSSLEEKFARYKICKKCGHKMFEDIDLIEECLQCGSDNLDEKLYLQPQVLYARRFSPIKASEDVRKRRRFNVQREAVDSGGNKQVVNINGMLLTYQKGSEIVSTNYGPYSDEGESMGFALCDKCGFSLDLSSQQSHDRSLEIHAKSACDGRFEYNIDLLSRIHADAITMQMPLPEEIGLEYLTTLLHSYLIAAAIYFETDPNELRGFIQEVPTPQEEEMYKIVIYDSTLGGSGVLKEFVENISEISAKALQLLDECSCEKACYKCLKTYYNQRDHEKLDKRLVRVTLQAFAEAGRYNIQDVSQEEYKKLVKPLSKSEIEEISTLVEGEETPIERMLREAIEKSGLPIPVMQYEMFDGDRLITKPDFAYPEKKIAIFADGFLYHKSKESFERDRNIDRWLQKNGWITLRFPGGLIYRNVQLCVNDIEKFLEV